MSFLISPYRFGVSGPVDPNFSNVVLLAGYNRAGTANSTPYTEESNSAHVLTRTGSGATGTYESGGKFGGRLYKSLATHFFSTPDSADFAFGSGNWTIETWVYFDNAPSSGFHNIIGQWDSGTNQKSWLMSVASNVLTLFVSSNGSTTITSANGSWAPSTLTWYHIAADYDGTAYRIYANGTMVGKEVASRTLHNSTAAMTLGAFLISGSGSSSFVGGLDETRITKGVARYASDGGYTVPVAAFPRS